jgi:hypothetical protein
MKWPDHPNLRLRPHAPNKGRGRLQVQVRRAYIATGVDTLSASEIYDWTYARRRQRMPTNLRWPVRRILRVIADPVGRADTIGRPILWKLKQPKTDAE